MGLRFSKVQAADVDDFPWARSWTTASRSDPVIGCVRAVVPVLVNP